MLTNPDLNDVVIYLTIAKIVLPPFVKMIRRMINKSITVIVITRDK